MDTRFQGSTEAGKDEWLTPPEIIKALGAFDLDPRAPVSPPWVLVPTWYCELEDGLSLPWLGRVWLNPPYGKTLGLWLKKIADHGNGIALVFARTETAAFQKYVFKKASALLFIEGRLVFHHVDGTRGKTNAGAPSVLIAYGENNVKALERCGIKGALVYLNKF